MSNIKELIRAEIERRKVDALDKGFTFVPAALQDLLSFLDTLPDEPVTDCHDLTEAAKKYAEEQAFWWIRENPYTSQEYAFKAGAEWQKRKMMEGAVEGDGEVCKLADRVWITPTDEKRFHQDVFDNFKSGDKVSIIVLPKED